MGWVSASPIASTGYGRQTKEIGYRLVDMGVDVTFIGTFGDVIIWGGMEEQETFEGNKVTVLALTLPQSAASVIHSYAQRYGFEILIGFMDCFGLEYLNNIKLPVIGYIPIDGPFTAKMKNYLRNYHKIIAFSRFGYKELQKWYPPSKIGFIPHGIDTKTFRPLNKREYDEAREWMATSGTLAGPIPKDCFLAVNLGANVGPRKCLPLLMRTWSKLVKMHEDDPPHLLIWTNAYAPGRGYDLVTHRINLGMEKYIHFPKYDPILQPASDEELRKILGGANIYVHNAVAEGFGLPTVEAMSCGCAPIAPANSAQKEYIVGNGWLVENIDPDDYIEFPVYVPTLQQYPVPSQKSLLEKLDEAYNSPDLVKKYGRKSRRFVVRNYAWNKVMPQWIKLLERTESELELFKKLSESVRSPPTRF